MQECHKTSVCGDFKIPTCSLFCKLVFRVGGGKCNSGEEGPCQWYARDYALQINTKVISLPRPWMLRISWASAGPAEPNYETGTFLGAQLLCFSSIKIGL